MARPVSYRKEVVQDHAKALTADPPEHLRGGPILKHRERNTYRSAAKPDGQALCLLNPYAVSSEARDALMQYVDEFMAGKETKWRKGTRTLALVPLSAEEPRPPEPALLRPGAADFRALATSASQSRPRAKKHAEAHGHAHCRAFGGQLGARARSRAADQRLLVGLPPDLLRAGAAARRAMPRPASCARGSRATLARRAGAAWKTPKR